MWVSNVINEVVFADLDLRFQAHPVTGDVTMLKNVDAIKRSVKNLVLTNRYDKPYRPSIYGGVLESLFENFDPILVMQLRDLIKTVLQYEPRATNILVDVEEISNNIDKNGINISVTFTPVNSSFNVTVDIFLERVR